MCLVNRVCWVRCTMRCTVAVLVLVLAAGCDRPQRPLPHAQTGGQDLAPDARARQAEQPEQFSFPWLAANEAYEPVISRIAPPVGFRRLAVAKGGFGAWLRASSAAARPAARTPLRRTPQVEPVRPLRRPAHRCRPDRPSAVAPTPSCGSGPNTSTPAAADDGIVFHFTSGDAAEWPRWRDGFRPQVRGNRVTWSRSAERDRSYANFRKYLDAVFTYCGTASLSKELDAVADPAQVAPGDVFIRGGHPGHAVIVVDVAAGFSGQASLPARGELHARAGNPRPAEPGRVGQPMVRRGVERRARHAGVDFLVLRASALAGVLTVQSAGYIILRVEISPEHKKVLSGESRGLAACCERVVLHVAAIGYGGVTRLRNWLFDTGMLAEHAVTKPVISIGNITAGGTGKTPAVEYVVRWFAARGTRPAIVSRGYGAREGRNDEALLLAAHLPGVPHRQNPNRLRAAIEAMKLDGANVLVLDDGFQHRRLARFGDIVLIDATCPFGYGHMLPRGLLREAAWGIRRADVIVITRCDQVDEAALTRLMDRLKRLAPAVPKALVAARAGVAGSVSRRRGGRPCRARGQASGDLLVHREPRGVPAHGRAARGGGRVGWRVSGPSLVHASGHRGDHARRDSRGRCVRDDREGRRKVERLVAGRPAAARAPGRDAGRVGRGGPGPVV